ncbi:flagellar hook-basal body complex protein [Photobacterium leiognathi]|uniref:flagellar hook protein FlgE n=1 Tax=Photobacterium leiognathi TaxID=553611 RepID=UPI001EDF3C5A|nr:flagellar hook-basal body complex protein [Photobacterium leiognathi]MCG3883684.1 flagellar hook-basal body complex protein [Photobacterium leiognathi]
MSNYMNNAKMGIAAASAALGASSNNIVNAETTGYKAESASFQSIYAGSSKEAGSGVAVASINRNFNAGSFIVTSQDTDLKVTGRGMFTIYNKSTSQMEYTRNGNFSFDKDGFFVDGNQNSVMGFPAGQTSGTPVPLSVDKTPLKPQLTDNIEVNVNLGHVDRQDKMLTTVRVYDSIGAPHDLNIEFNGEKRNTPADGQTQWNVTMDIDGTPLDASKLSLSTITFNADGSLDTTAMKDGNITLDLSAELGSYGVTDVNLDFSSATNFDGEMKVRNINSNGQAAGEFAGTVVTDDGYITARYTNGKQVEIGMVALADFESMDGLTVSNTGNFVQSKASGAVNYGVSGTSGFGRINSGGLEGSNVDSSNELVNMISFQRDNQASANILKTGKALDQAILNL